jgi:hypothetical protein
MPELITKALQKPHELQIIVLCSPKDALDVEIHRDLDPIVCEQQKYTVVCAKFHCSNQFFQAIRRRNDHFSFLGSVTPFAKRADKILIGTDITDGW